MAEQLKKKRLNTQLESNGAEFLVLGNLMVEGISAHKNYVNMPGYDRLATSPVTVKMAKIQVKSRYPTSASRFLIKNFHSDFVVYVALNRGSTKAKKKPTDSNDRRSPEFYVFPTSKIERLSKPSSRFGAIPIKSIPDFGKHRDRWDLIRDFLEKKSKRRRTAK